VANEENQAIFENALRTDLANLTDVPVGGIVITAVKQGSVIVDITIVSVNPPATQAILSAFLSNSSSTLPTVDADLPLAAFENGIPVATVDPSSSSSTLPNLGLTDGDLAGIVLAVICFVGLVIGLTVGLLRRKWAKEEKAERKDVEFRMID